MLLLVTAAVTAAAAAAVVNDATAGAQEELQGECQERQSEPERQRPLAVFPHEAEAQQPQGLVAQGGEEGATVCVCFGVCVCALNVCVWNVCTCVLTCV